MVVAGNFDGSFDYPDEIHFTLSKPCPQNFSIPSGIIHYICHAPSSSIGYQKLLQTCKFFIFKKYMVITDNFVVREESNDMMLDYLLRINALSDDLPYKLWHQRILEMVLHTDQFAMTRLLNNTYQCNLAHLYISHQKFSFGEYLRLTEGGGIKELNLHNVEIYYLKSGKMVPFECLLEQVPNVVGVSCSYTDTPESAFTSKTAENLIALPKFQKLKDLKICDNYPKFNASQFCDFIKKTNTNFLKMTFCSTIDATWFESIETVFAGKDSEFTVKKKNSLSSPPFSRTNGARNLTTIVIRKNQG